MSKYNIDMTKLVSHDMAQLSELDDTVSRNISRYIEQKRREEEEARRKKAKKKIKR